MIIDFRQAAIAAATGVAILTSGLAPYILPTPAHAAYPGEKGSPIIKPLEICTGAGVSFKILSENQNNPAAVRAWESFCVGVYMAQYMAIIEPLAWQNAGGILQRYGQGKGATPEPLDFTKDLIWPYKFTTQQQYDQFWKDVDVQTRKDFAEKRAELKTLPQFAGKSDNELNGIIATARITILQQMIETMDTAYRTQNRTFQPYHALLIVEELVRVKFEPSQFNLDRYNSNVKAIEDRLPQKRGTLEPREPANRQYGAAPAEWRHQVG
ncbi:MAG: hypothetical protein SFW65_10510 [Alphaproteobacteria bacterium]|nr:hypothetical protein [Alphaproteobacteria bacterium]